MTKDEAARECERLNREHPDRDHATWLPRQQPSGDWTVVKVTAASLKRRRGPVTPEVRPQPIRPDPAQDVPQEPRPWWGAG